MAFDAFLKLSTGGINDQIVIQGESQDKNHPGEIEIESFSWGVSNPATLGSSGGGAGSGKASVSSLNFLGPLSKASPNLMLACATGKHIPQAVLTCRKAGGPTQVEFLKIKLSDVLVESYQESGNIGGDFPEDSFSLFFVKIDFLYTVARTGEVVETSFDQSQTGG